LKSILLLSITKFAGNYISPELISVEDTAYMKYLEGADTTILPKMVLK